MGAVRTGSRCVDDVERKPSMPVPSTFVNFMVQMRDIGLSCDYTISDRGPYATFRRRDGAVQAALLVSRYSPEWGTMAISECRQYMASMKVKHA